MTKFVIALLLVIGVVVGGIVALLQNRRGPMPSQDVLKRVRQRNRALDAEEERER